MKNLIIETAEISKSAIDAHVRNSLEVAKIIDGVVVSKERDINKIKNVRFENIIVSYGSFYFNFKPFISIIKKNPDAKLWWMTNEYNLAMNGSVYTLFKERGYGVLSNFVEKAFSHKKYNHYEMLNINLLLFFPDHQKNYNKKYGIVYYGTFRPGRKKYFEMLLRDGVYISTSKKNIPKFQMAGCDGRFIEKLKWPYEKETLGFFRYSLYIEDEFTHDNFNYLANRFYEALNCQCVMIFHVSCLNTLKLSGLKDYENFMVEDFKDFKNFTKENYPVYLEMQKKWIEWASQQKKEVISTLKKLLLR